MSLTKEQIRYVKERLKDLKWQKQQKVKHLYGYTYRDLKTSSKYSEEVNEAIKVLIKASKEDFKRIEEQQNKIEKHYLAFVDQLTLTPTAVDGFKILNDFDTLEI